MKTPPVEAKLVTTHAERVRGIGVLDSSPFCMLTGTAPAPLTKCVHACSEVTVVPAAAPTAFRVDEPPVRPLPAHCTTSSSWQAVPRSVKSAWQSAGQMSAVA